MKRILSLILSILLLPGCVTAKRVARAYLRAESPGVRLHGQTAYGDMVLSYPDPDEVMQAVDEALAIAEAATDPQDLILVYESQMKAYNELVSAASLAYVRYCQDTTDPLRSAEYGKLNNALYAIQIRLAGLEKKLTMRRLWTGSAVRTRAPCFRCGMRRRSCAADMSRSVPSMP